MSATGTAPARVKTGRTDVLATAYVKQGKTLDCAGQLGAEPADVKLTIDWRPWGWIRRRRTSMHPPCGVPDRRALPADGAIPVAPARGWLLMLDEEKHDVPVARVTDVYRAARCCWKTASTAPCWASRGRRSYRPGPRPRCRLEKGAVAIEASANNCAMAERPLPPGVTLAQCTVFSGSDKGASWGPGMALAWKNKTLRINLRPDGRCGVDDGAGQWFGSFVPANYWYYLRIRLEKDEVLAEVSPDNRLWEVIHAFRGASSRATR